MKRTLLCAGLLAASAFAQQNDKAIPLSKVERKNKAPVSNEVLHVSLPKPVELTRPDGLRVLVLENHRLPTVYARLTILGAGAVFEPAETPGLASFTAQMLNQGTASRSSRQIAEEVEGMGASISAVAPFGSSTTVITASGLSETFPQLLALAADIVLHPAFPESELARLKLRQKAQLMQMRAQPRFLANEVFNKAVYGSHPAAVVAPTVASIDAMTPELLRQWHDQRYVPQNAILGIAGDVTVDQVRDALGTLPEWNRTDLATPQPPPAKAAEVKKVRLVDRPNSVQTTLMLGNIAVKRTDPDYIPLVVMDRIVGGSPAARLFLNLRENKGYTYNPFSSLNATLFAGPWSAFADVRTPVTEGAMTEFLNEIRRIRDEKVPAAELDEAKHALVASFALSLENPSELLDRATVLRIYNLPAGYWDAYPAKIAAVTAGDVQRVAQKYLNPDSLQVVAVGDAAKIREALAKFAPVEVRDAQGKIETPAPPAPAP
ncbi:MAG: pitrilysin family protein [Bryobacteraceae bacterium]